MVSNIQPSHTYSLSLSLIIHTHNHPPISGAIHSTISHTHPSPCYTHPHTWVSHTHTHTPSLFIPLGCHTHMFPVTRVPILLFPYYTPSCVSPTEPQPLPRHTPTFPVAHTPSDVTVAHLHVSHPATASLESHPHSSCHIPSPASPGPTPPQTRLCHTLNCLPLIHTASHSSHPETAHSASSTHPLACHTHPLTHVSPSATAPSGVTCTLSLITHTP